MSGGILPHRWRVRTVSSCPNTRYVDHSTSSHIREGSDPLNSRGSTRSITGRNKSEIQSETVRQTEKQRDRERNTERDRQTEKQRERQTDTLRERERTPGSTPSINPGGMCYRQLGLANRAIPAVPRPYMASTTLPQPRPGHTARIIHGVSIHAAYTGIQHPGTRPVAEYT